MKLFSTKPLFLGRLKPWQALLLAYGLMVPLVIADLFADPEVHFSVFYLVPVAIAAWRASLRSAIVLSIVSAVTWDAMELMDGTSTDKFWIHIWNLGTRLFFYIVVTVLLHHLRVTMDWLIKISRNDPLTRLLNHSAFIETVDEELLRQQRNGEWVSLAFLDLDHFKQINDQQGHQAGDRALMAVAKVLRGRLRRTDKIGRLGGDEFAILMPETDSAGARAILSPLREMLKNALAREQFQVTFSVGVVSCDYCMDGKRLLQEADALMYEVKRNGRDNLLQREMAG